MSHAAAVQSHPPYYSGAIAMSHADAVQSHPPYYSGAIAMSHADVIKSHVDSLTLAAVKVMKKNRHLFSKSWDERYMAVRGGTLFYAETRDDVLKMTLAASHSYHHGDEHEKHVTHVIELKGCKAEECLAETDVTKNIWAFTLVKPKVVFQMNGQAFSSPLVCRNIRYFYPPAKER